MWQSRNKTDLIIEVWEKLDCESVGRDEIKAIETAVKAEFGPSAVESPMIVARLLADEGAELRHSEIMQFYVERASDRPYDAALRNLIDISDFPAVLRSLKNAEGLRRRLTEQNDRDGMRLLKSDVIEAKKQALASASNKKLADAERAGKKEIAEWLTLWLQSPDLFENWIRLRRESADFTKKFGKL